MAEGFPLGRRLRRIRRLRDWTQDELAKRSGINVITISRLETGNAEHAYAKTVRDLARTLKVSADYLLGLSDDDRIMRQLSEQDDDEPALAELAPGG